MNEICRKDCVHAGAVAAARERIAEDERRAPDAASWFKTLGNPQRLTILRALRHGELCVCDIAVLLGLSTGATSQHLKQLRHQGWLTMRQEATMVYYRLHSDAPWTRLRAELDALAEQTPAPAPGA
ncbi:ArsR/SmtB family transcription factor [Salinisphaera orenii]|uniref:ArsR/SmtB family transcription factor n=1 Tax=Salinisphaera orenii TaxID=856731 RepID=UPI000DBE97E5